MTTNSLIESLNRPHINLSGLARQVGLSSSFIARCMNGEKKLSIQAQWNIAHALAPLELRGWVFAADGPDLVAVMFTGPKFWPASLKRLRDPADLHEFLTMPLPEPAEYEESPTE